MLHVSFVLIFDAVEVVTIPTDNAELMFALVCLLLSGADRLCVPSRGVQLAVQRDNVCDDLLLHRLFARNYRCYTSCLFVISVMRYMSVSFMNLHLPQLVTICDANYLYLVNVFAEFMNDP